MPVNPARTQGRPSFRSLGLAVPLALALAGGALLAQDAEFRPGYVITKQGQKIEGKIAEKDGKVLVQKPGGSLELDPAEVTVHYNGGAATAPTSGRKFVEVKLPDGTTLRGEIVNQGEGKITLKPRGRDGKDLPERTIPQEGSTVTPIDEPGGASDVDVDVATDYDGRFTLERPSPDWRVRKSTSPEVRALLSLTGKDAFVAVIVRPVVTNPSPYDVVNKENAGKVQRELDAELKADLDKFAAVGVDISELFGTPIYECRYEGNFPQETTTYQFIEARFAREGLVYSLRAGAEKALLKASAGLESKLREAFTGFSFVASQNCSEEAYDDLLRGFGMDRPSPKWTLDVRPFDEREPLYARNEDGRAEIRVQLDPSGKNAGSFVDELLKKNSAREGYAKLDRKSGQRNGFAVETYRCEYYEPGSSRKRDFQGVVAVVAGTLIHAEGASPIADVDAKSLQSEVSKALDALRIFDSKEGRKHLLEGATAAKELAKAIESQKRRAWDDCVNSCTEALKLHQDYVRALALRASARAELKKWKEYREDLDRVMDLDPRPEVSQRCAVLIQSEAAQRTRDKEWKEALKVWKESLRLDPKNDKLKKEFLAFFTLWWNEEKKVAPSKLRDAVDEVTRSGPNDDAFTDLFATFYVDAGRSILSADKNNHERARSCARRALELDKQSQPAKDLAKSCDDAKKSLQPAPTPPKGKK